MDRQFLADLECELLLAAIAASLFSSAVHADEDAVKTLDPVVVTGSRIEHSSFDLPVTIARPFNTYGPRQSARAVIPTVISQLLSARTTLKLGALSPTRDFNFVQDTCDGFLALAACDEAVGQTVNIGSGSEISIGDTVRLIADIIGVSVEIECDEQRLRPVNSEVERLCCDNSLIKSLTGFSPRYSLEDGLKATVEWLRQPQNLARYKADIFNV